MCLKPSIAPDNCQQLQEPCNTTHVQKYESEVQQYIFFFFQQFPTMLKQRVGGEHRRSGKRKKDRRQAQPAGLTHPRRGRHSLGNPECQRKQAPRSPCGRQGEREEEREGAGEAQRPPNLSRGNPSRRATSPGREGQPPKGPRGRSRELGTLPAPHNLHCKELAAKHRRLSGWPPATFLPNLA